MRRNENGSRVRRRAANGLLISIAFHALSVWLWPAASAPPRPRASSSSALVEIRVAAPPPVRPPVVIVVGPDAARRGGSPSGSAVSRLARPQATRSVEAGPSPVMPDAIDVADDQGVPSANDDRTSMTRQVPAALLPQPSVSDDAAFDDLIRAQGSRLAAGRGPGAGGFGAGGSGRNGLTLVLGVSGRHVAGSSVVTAPMVAQQRPIACTLPRGKVRSIVRLLVLRDGTVAAPRLLESSGQARFDACALRYAQALRFEPGLDGSGRRLDVWVHVEIVSSGPEMM